MYNALPGEGGRRLCSKALAFDDRHGGEER